MQITMLCRTVEALLNCPDLNLDDLEEVTSTMINRAQRVLKAVKYAKLCEEKDKENESSKLD